MEVEETCLLVSNAAVLVALKIKAFSVGTDFGNIGDVVWVRRECGEGRCKVGQWMGGLPNRMR